MPRRYAWARWPAHRLLELRMKDLDLTLEGTWLAACRDRLLEELEAKGVRLRPHVWLSDEWFAPSTSPGFAIPFYLAHPRLMRLERSQMFDVEGGSVGECMRIMRHEAGHAIQNAYLLNRRKRWQQLFGRSSTRYPQWYRPNPSSRPAGGAMVALQATVDEVLPMLVDRGHLVSVAAENGPRATVVSGDDEMVAELAAYWQAQGRKTRRLRVSHAFHSPLMESARTGLENALEKAEIKDASVPVYANVTAAPEQIAGEIRTMLGAQLTSPVLNGNRPWRT